MAVPPFWALCHKKENAYNSTIHCPIYMKLYMYDQRPALKAVICWYSVIFIAPPPGDRKWPKLDVQHILTNSSYKFDRNVMKYGVDTLQTCDMKSYSNLMFSSNGVGVTRPPFWPCHHKEGYLNNLSKYHLICTKIHMLVSHDENSYISSFRQMGVAKWPARSPKLQPLGHTFTYKDEKQWTYASLSDLKKKSLYSKG